MEHAHTHTHSIYIYIYGHINMHTEMATHVYAQALHADSFWTQTWWPSKCSFDFGLRWSPNPANRCCFLWFGIQRNILIGDGDMLKCRGPCPQHQAWFCRGTKVPCRRGAARGCPASCCEAAGVTEGTGKWGWFAWKWWCTHGDYFPFFPTYSLGKNHFQANASIILEYNII